MAVFSKFDASRHDRYVFVRNHFFPHQILAAGAGPRQSPMPPTTPPPAAHPPTHRHHHPPAKPPPPPRSRRGPHTHAPYLRENRARPQLATTPATRAMITHAADGHPRRCKGDPSTPSTLPFPSPHPKPKPLRYAVKNDRYYRLPQDGVDCDCADIAAQAGCRRIPQRSPHPPTPPTIPNPHAPPRPQPSTPCLPYYFSQPRAAGEPARPM